MILGIAPAVGNGLHHMKANGYLGRFIRQTEAYREAFHAVRFFSYVSAYDDLEFAAYREAGLEAIMPDGDGAGLWHAAIRPVRSARYFRDLSVLRCISLLGAIPAIGARVLYGTPFVVSVGADYRAIAQLHGRRQDMKWRVLEAVATNLAHTVLTPSLTFAAALRRRHRRARVVYLPNWVDTTRFSPEGRVGRQPGRTVLYVGRLVKEKNLLDLALACRAAEATLVCIGEGPLKSELIGHGATVLGVVPWADLPAYHAQADAFAMVSHTEGHCKALAEAMASGLPCVVSNAVTEGIRPGVNALQVCTRTGPHNIAAALRLILRDRKVAAALGAEARRTAAMCWGPDLLASETKILASAAR